MEVERLFAEFCRTREPGLLGGVFDACADDLFAVALHLCRDRVDAEDIVQATFLAAIARANRWQPQRPLRPWLLGILHREARHLRRRARRAVDGSRISVPPQPEPPQLVLAAETRSVVAAAIPELPQPYRDVIELHLVQALAPGAIAERLRRSPGAVRTQLWRGLELLRHLLPKGLAIGLAAEVRAQSSLAVVRAKVLAAAATRSAAATGAASLILGGVLMSKLLVAGAVFAAAILWWTWPPADVAPRTNDVAATASPAPAAVAAPGTGASARDAIAPVPLRSAAETAPAPPDAKEPAAGPSDLAILVVDGKGDAVRDATVSVFDHGFRIEPGGSKHPTDRRSDGPPRGSWRTDDLGRTRVTFVDGCLVSATKEGIGWSGDMELKPSASRVPDELTLMLLPVANVRGRVLAADGLPAAGALVYGYQQHRRIGLRYERYTGNTPRATADLEGRFVLQVLAGEDFSLDAQHNGRFVRNWLRALQPGAESEVTLRFPGAFRVRGVLLGEDGRPLAGSVRLIGNETLQLGVPSLVKPDAEGRFEILLAEACTFVLVGGAVGQTSARAEVVLEATCPHAEVTLRATPFVDVEGKVVDERGEAIAGAWVGLGYVVERDAVHEQRSDLHGILPRGPADAQGVFRFRVPAGYRYRVVARATPDTNDLWVKGPEFAAPAKDLVVVVREADKQGFVVTGRIVAATDGSPVRGARIDRVHISERGNSTGPCGRGDDGTFRIGPFAPGWRYSFAFEAEGFARTVIGPFDATVRTEEVVVRLSRCGTVRCRVLRADGTPAASAFVNLAQQPVPDPFVRAWQGEADRDGCIEFADVIPGAYKVLARATVHAEPGVVGDTVVRPQQTSTVKLVLQN